MLIENVDIVRRKRASLVQALQRFSRALERVLRLAEIAPRGCDPRISFDRASEQTLRFAELALLHLDPAEEIERIEPVGRRLEEPRVDSLRFAQLPLLMQGHRFAQRHSGIERARGYFHRPLLLSQPVDPRDAA